MSSAPDEIVVRSPAKINWLLRVPGRRDDGFHEIETLFQTISLEDLITCTPSDQFRLSCSDPTVPVDSSNLVSRAVSLLQETGAEIPLFDIHIEKSIPSGGGLGGGSSNAASILREFQERFAPNLDQDRLRTIATRLGSDVPFFLQGGTAYATGRGERLTPLPSVAGVRLLVVLPEEKVSTAEAYALLGRGPVGEDPYLGLERASRLIDGGPFEESEDLVNDFEEVIFERLPRLGQIRDRLLDEGAAWARMSGSGSTIVGAFRDEESRQKAYGSFRDVRVVPAETM